MSLKSKKKREPKQDAMTNMTFEMTTPTFSDICTYLEVSISIGNNEIDDAPGINKFTRDEIQKVEETLNQARELHKNGEVEAAWYYLCETKAFVNFRHGVMEGRYQSSDEAGAARIGSLNGRKGALKKQEVDENIREKHVLLLLSMHEEKPFVRRNQLRDAASKLGPHGGEEISDDKWAQRLINKTRLKPLYDSLSKKRKP